MTKYMMTIPQRETLSKLARNFDWEIKRIQFGLSDVADIRAQVVRTKLQENEYRYGQAWIIHSDGRITTTVEQEVTL